MECAAPNCSQVIPQERLKRYPNTKTCSTSCSKDYRKDYVANWMGFYVLKKADIETDPRFLQAQASEDAGDKADAFFLRGKVLEQAIQADQNRRHESGGDIKTYRQRHPKQPPPG